MPLSKGDRLGPYEILEPIGKGGMGEVYRAHDPRLKRDVAIKVSAARFNERFEREARAVAALNHPNICQIYDVGPDYLVMELIEGPTLSERIKEGAIPLEEALPIAEQIAAALEAAHEKSITHRDLKPGNIKIKADGVVKVLDFGLAKLGGTPVTAPSEDSPTLSMAATQAGMILGTAAYMAPEQAKGKQVDKRADIWAFGVVLYEMVTGRRLFKGEDMVEILAAVVHGQPDLSAVPPRVRRLIAKCLEKDPQKRLRDMSAIEFLLVEEAAPQAVRNARRSWLPWAAAAVLAISTGVALWAPWRVPPPPSKVRFQVQPPEKGAITNPRLSPDGRFLAFSSQGKLWIHSFETLESRAIAGTEGAYVSFWSPDGANIGFFAGGSLKRVALSGGVPQTLAPAPNAAGGSWSRDDVILFAPNIPSGLMRVSAAGGTPVAVTKIEGAAFHLFPEFLPDGKHFLYSVVFGKESTGIVAGSLDGGPPVHLRPEVASADYSDGHLLFRLGETLMAQAFDPDQLRLSGDAFPVTDRVSGDLGYGAFTVSRTGMLAYVGGTSAGLVQLTWVDRAGKSLMPFGPPGLYARFRLASDDKRIVYDNEHDVWLLDSVRGVSSKLTFDPADDNVPMWSPDEQRVVWPSHRGGSFDLYVKAANGTGSETLLVKMDTATGWATDWSRDGRFLMFQRPGDETGQDLWIAPQPADGKDAQPFPYLNSEYNEEEGRFSPDGKWVAYTSTETGLSEIYVQSFPKSGAKFQISTGGGLEPQWSPDGAELYYLSSARNLTAVPIVRSAAEPFRPGLPKELFPVPPVVLSGFTARSYAVSRDGKRFLISSSGIGTSAPVTVMLNWRAALKK